MSRPRDRLAAWLANQALRMATPKYRRMIRGAIEYGLRSAARDHAEGRSAPDDWRPEQWPTDVTAFPVVRGDQ